MKDDVYKHLLDSKQTSEVDTFYLFKFYIGDGVKSILDFSSCAVIQSAVGCKTKWKWTTRPGRRYLIWNLKHDWFIFYIRLNHKCSAKEPVEDVSSDEQVTTPADSDGIANIL